MNYNGKLYGKVGRKHFDTGKTTEDWDRLERIERAAKEMLHRATEGMPRGYADGQIGLTDHQAAAIWLKGALSENGGTES
jgi:hypothetical protein